MKKTTESKINPEKKRITLSDINTFAQNIFYFLKLGNQIYGKLFYKNLAYKIIKRTISFSTSIFYGIFVDCL